MSGTRHRGRFGCHKSKIGAAGAGAAGAGVGRARGRAPGRRGWGRVGSGRGAAGWDVAGQIRWGGVVNSEESLSALYTVGRYTFAPTVRGLFRPWTEGLHHIPEEGPAILASNHLSVADSIFLPVRRTAHHQLLGQGRVLLRPRGCGAGPLPRCSRGSGRSRWTGVTGTPRWPRSTWRSTVLNDGGLFGIYPEGTRSPDGKMHRGHTGIARDRAGGRRTGHPGGHDGYRQGTADRLEAAPAGPRHRGTDRCAAGLHAVRRRSTATPSCCGRSPTTSWPTSDACPVRSTCSGTRPGTSPAPSSGRRARRLVGYECSQRVAPARTAAAPGQQADPVRRAASSARSSRTGTRPPCAGC